MAKIGRNDPCSCGSGKKYKHCCYGEEHQPSMPLTLGGEDADWQKIRRTEGIAVGEILDFADRRYGRDLLGEAFAEFGLWGEYEIDEGQIENLFIPWFAFNWTADGAENRPAGRRLLKLPLGLEYLEYNGRGLDEYQRAFILTACSQPFSFFAVTDVVVGKSLGLRDVFVDRTFTVKEASGSKILKRGDIIFGRVVSFDNQAIVVGTGTILLPPMYHSDLLDIRDGLRKKLRTLGFELNLDALLLRDLEIREIYLRIAEKITNPPPVQLQNTDGDPLAFIELYFELGCSPEAALEGLKSLALPEFQESLLDDSVRDSEGNLLEVSFDWQKRGNKLHPEWDNTILGKLTIKGGELTAEVNSEKRAKKVKSEITKSLGKKVTYTRSVYQSIEEKLKEMDSRPPDEEALKEMEELQSRPEVQVLLEQQMKAHWEDWYNRRLPVLQNKTPIAAARTKAGRERLEALLVDFERRNEDVTLPHLRVDVAAIREKLGLAHPNEQRTLAFRDGES